MKKLIAVYDIQPFDKVYTAFFFQICFKIILLLKANIPTAFQAKIMTACFFPCEANAPVQVILLIS